MMASPVKGASPKSSVATKTENKLLAIVVHGSGTITVDPSALKEANVYQGISLSKTSEVLPRANQPTDLIILVNHDETLSLSKEMIDAITAATQMTGPKMYRKLANSDVSGEELTPVESSKFVTRVPQEITIPQSQNVSSEINDLFQMNPEEMERLESALLSDQAKQILGENVTAMLDILSVEGQGDEESHPTASQAQTVLLEHNYATPPPTEPDPLNSTRTPHLTQPWAININETKAQVTVTDGAAQNSTPAINEATKAVTASPTKLPDSTQNITEAMLDEKFRQELLDKDDYSHFSGKSSDDLSESDSDLKIVINPKKETKSRPRKTPQRNRKPVKGKREDAAKKPQEMLPVVLPSPENKPLKVNADLKLKDPPIVTPVKKLYPKRENRRLPDRLKDSAQPALFSIPDVIHRFGAEKNVDSAESVTVETVEHGILAGQTVNLSEENVSLASCTFVGERTLVDSLNDDVLKDEELMRDEMILQQHLADRGSGHQVVEQAYSAETNESVPGESGLKVSKRIRKRKISFGEIDEIKPKARVTKPKQKPKGKGAQGAHGSRPKPVPVANDSHSENNENDDTSDDKSWNSEDDPDRLWCICKKPHNNRFMICCDMCEDWFHGHCVGVTKSMGKTMEEQGKEWTCPACKKKKAEKVLLQGRVPGKEMPTKMPTNRAGDKNDGPGSPNKAVKRRSSLTMTGERQSSLSKITKVIANEATTPSVADSESSQENITYCIVCKMQARSNSIYCSDNCILKHASTSKPVAKSDSLNSAPASNPLKPNHPTIKISGEIKMSPKVDPHSKSVRLVKIASIPPAGSSSHAVKKPSITATKIQPQSLCRPPEAFYPKTKQTVLIKPKQVSLMAANSSKQTPKKRIKFAGSAAQSDSKTPVKTPVKTPGSKSNKEKMSTKKVDSKRLSSADVKLPVEMQSPDAEKGGGTEPIRITVRDTLHGLLLARLQECQDELKDIVDEDVKKIGHDIEEELYSYFKEAGSKYKSKYRSLVFNIRDPTNLTLFRKIADKSVTPHQLVRLSPEELASQQLAQWRERESKHQIEMIKKNELDLMALSKSVVMKTHKGEHIIDSNDIQNQTVLEYEADHPDNFTQSSVTSTVSDGSFENKERSKSNSEKKDSSRSSSKHKSKSRSRDGKRDDRSRDRSRHKKSSRRRDSDHKKSSMSKLSSSSSKLMEDKDKSENKVNVKKESNEVMEAVIETTSTQPSDQNTTRTSEQQMKEDAIKLEDINADREPTSTVPDVASETSTFDKTSFVATQWTGFVSMQDVAKFSATIQVISGVPLTTCKDLPPIIDIIGRIDPDTVWQYISKMKRSGTKEIIVVRLNADNDEETSRYTLLYTYLNSRNRLGVAGSLPKSIKDFYVLPLSSTSPLPQALLPLDGPGFQDSRPHLLLGVIVRPRRKRPFSKVSRVESLLRSYTPPPSGDRGLTPPIKSLFGGNPAYKSLRKESKKVKVRQIYEQKKKEIREPDDGDEPYSPGGSDVSDLDDLLSAPQSDLKRRMDIINRQIAEQKQEIKNISSAIIGDPSVEDSTHDSNEAYSPSASFTPPHRTSFPFSDKPGIMPNIPTDISLPANIQEILANIKKQSDAKLDIKMDPIVQNYGSKKDDKANKPAVASYTPTTIKSTKGVDSEAQLPAKSRDPRIQEAPKPSSTLSKLSDAELIEKAAMEMGAEQTTASNLQQPLDIHSYGLPLPPGVDSLIQQVPTSSYVSYAPGQHNYAMNPTNFLPPHGTQMPLQIPLTMPPPGMNPNIPPPGYPGGSFGMPFGPNFMGPPPNMGFNPNYAGPPPQQQTGHFGHQEAIGRSESGGGGRFRGQGDHNQRRGRSRWNQRDASPRRSSRPQRDSSDRSRNSRDSKTSGSRSSKPSRRRSPHSRERDSDSS